MKYKVNEFSKLVGVTPQTLRNWDHSGKLKPESVTPGGTRIYSDKQLELVKQPMFHTKVYNKDTSRITIGYYRVSTKKQKDDLDRQMDTVKLYMAAKGYQFKMISDIGSGINYKNKGLTELIKEILSGRVERVVILHKDRLVRFGYELIETICNEFNTQIEIIDSTPKSNEQEIVEDLIQIITTFSAKLHGKRANKTKKIIQELSDVKSSSD